VSVNACVFSNGDIYVAFRSESDGSFSYLGNLYQITGSALQDATNIATSAGTAAGHIFACSAARDARLKAGVDQW
jgi:hypothetical protein